MADLIEPVSLTIATLFGWSSPFRSRLARPWRSYLSQTKVTLYDILPYAEAVKVT